LKKASDEGHQCTAFVEWATAAMQAERRVRKLVEKCDIVIDLMGETKQWATQTSVGPHGNGGVLGAVMGINKQLSDAINRYRDLPDNAKGAYINEHHAHCTGWCWTRPANQPPSATPKLDWCAEVLKELAEPFSEFLQDLGKEQLADHREAWGIKL
jgi:hypothetical protein